MKRLFILGILFSFLPTVKGQHQGAWIEHISYTQLRDVVQHGNLTYAASSQGIFTYALNSGEIDFITKQSGLTATDIVSLDFDPQSRQLIVGYRNGNIDLVRGQSVINISDIARSNLFIGNRRLNQVKLINNRLYVSCGFGLVVIDLTQQIVLSTNIIGPGGTQIEVFQVDFNPDNDTIYAATEDGLYKANINSSLSFFQNWSRVSALGQRPFNFVTVFNGKPFANYRSPEGANNDSVFYLNNGVWQWFNLTDPQTNSELRASEDLLIVANTFNVKAFNANFGLIYNLEPGNTNAPDFEPVKAIRSTQRDRLWIASNAEGLYEFNPLGFLIPYLPEGPYRNNVYSLHHNGEELFVSTAALNQTWTPQFNRAGVYRYKNFRWDRLEPQQYGDLFDIVAVKAHPENPNRLFLSSWGGGVAEVLDNELVEVHTPTSTGALTPVQNTGSPRVGWIDFDSRGNMWVVTSQNDQPLSVRRPNGSWETFSLGSSANSTTLIQRMMVTSNDQVWIQLRNNGIVVFREDANGNIAFERLTQNDGQGALPTNSVNDFDEDRNGAMWIGTSAGVGVIFNPLQIFESGGNYDAVRITFEEDGVVQALLSQENVTAVKVDGANKKWFGTSFRGAFYVSSDGREEIYNFRAENSPLPSNVIMDIEIDDETGEVFIATEQGIRSYQGAATRGSEVFQDPYAYPNPVRPDYRGPIFIRNLVTDAIVKITDLYGNLIFETRAEGGQAVWDGNTFSGQAVGSGVYQAYMTDNMGFETFVAKILIVR